jgi:predicted RNase H-like nuclease
MSKILDLAKKLNELAKRGEGGEKENAERMLRRLMKEHNLNEKDLEDEQVFNYCQRIKLDSYSLFFQISGTVNKTIKPRRQSNKHNTCYFKCTKVEYLELLARFEFYERLFKEETEVLFLAFLSKHDLYVKVTKEEMNDLTDEEKERRKRAAFMAEGLKDASYLKQLGNEKI